MLPIKEDGQFEFGFRRSNQHQNIDYLAENEDSNGEILSMIQTLVIIFYTTRK